MSEQEFELYLSLLSKLMKLNPNQRAEISDEMRDHLEARFNDLVENGCDRKEAIELALEEFGDANVLAGEFSLLATQQRRRKIMRLTFGTIVSSACLIFILQAMWPESHLPNQNQFVTNRSFGEGEKDKADKTDNKPAPENSKTAKVIPAEEKTWIYTSYSESEKHIAEFLERSTSLDFVDATLVDIIEYIKDLKQIPIIIKFNHIAEEGNIDPEEGNISFSQADGKLRSALNSILGDLNLTYYIQNEILVIDTHEGELNQGMVTRVYNCRDLLSVPSVGMGDSASVTGTNSYNSSAAFGSKRISFGGGRSNKGKRVINKHFDPEVREESLIKVIKKSTGNEDSWAEDDETGATIQPYHGMLIIKAPEHLHRKVVELLEMLRESFRRDDLLNEELSMRNKGYVVPGQGSPYPSKEKTRGFGGGLGRSQDWKEPTNRIKDRRPGTTYGRGENGGTTQEKSTQEKSSKNNTKESTTPKKTKTPKENSFGGGS